MADAVTDPKEAGWKRDPSGRFAGRYWDGSAWTEHVVSQDRVRSTDPLPAPATTPASAPATAPAVASSPARPAPTAAPEPPARPAAAPAPVISTIRPAPAPAPVVPTTPRPALSPTRGWRAWPLWARVALPAALVVVLLVAVTRGGKDDTPGSTSKPSASETLAIGATARTDDFEVTVYGFKDPQAPGQFLKPSAGTHYVTVDLQLANRSSTQKNFSSLLQIHLLDASNRQFDPTFGEVAPPAPDGEIPPGEAIRGMALFEIPDGTTGLRVRVQGSLTAAGAYFALA